MKKKWIIVWVIIWLCIGSFTVVHQITKNNRTNDYAQVQKQIKKIITTVSKPSKKTSITHQQKITTINLETLVCEQGSKPANPIKHMQ